MEKALRLITKLKNNLVADDELVRAAWLAAVGPRLEAHARFRELVRDRAVIEVDDRIWQSQLASLERPIVEKLEKLVGRRVVSRIEYRVAIPRPKPQAAPLPEFALAARDPEANRIADPSLRRIYLQSKRKAKIS